MRRTPQQVFALIAPDLAQSVAREHVQAIDHQCRNARAADRLMPLTTYYGPRPLRAVPLAQLLEEGRWAP